MTAEYLKNILAVLKRIEKKLDKRLKKKKDGKK
jgi:hypothetical protein